MICIRLTLFGTRLGERVSVSFQPCWLLELIAIHVAKEAVVFFFFFFFLTRDSGPLSLFFNSVCLYQICKDAIYM